MENHSGHSHNGEDDLIASNLLLRLKLEMECDIIVNEDLPFSLAEQNHLLMYLYSVETVLKKVNRRIVQNFAGGNYYFKNNEEW
jgi:hypothetical protein